MKHALAAFFCLIAGAAAASPIQPLARDQHPPEACALSVEFVSICCGPDRAVKERIERAVIAERRVVRAYSMAWGREGETTLCLVTRRRADARALAARYSSWAKHSSNPALTKVRLGPKLAH